MEGRMTTTKTPKIDLPDDVRARLIAAGRRTEMRVPELGSDDAAVCPERRAHIAQPPTRY
jgi:hypothetical protein